MIKRYGILMGALLAFAALISILSNSANSGASDQALAFLRPVADFYLKMFNSPTVAIGLCLGMIILGITLAVYYSFVRILPTIGRLKNVAEQLREIRRNASPIVIFQDVDRVMSSSATVSKSWSIYRSTLVAQPDGRVRSPISPDRYFDMKMLELNGLRLRFYMGLPNDFVGVGLIFTFLGLVAGLYFATESMMSADLGAARSALVSLLHAATFKFLTSITGIGVSLMLSWTQRLLLDALQHQLDEVQYMLEWWLPAASGAATTAPAAEPDGKAIPMSRPQVQPRPLATGTE